MKKTSIIIAGILLISVMSMAGTEQPLDQEQILHVFSSLKSQIRLSWIPSGTIVGTHIHIDDESNEIVTTIEKVKYDGDKFRWAIDVESHVNLEQKPIRNEDARMNAKRIFSWNGHEYTLYFKSGNSAIVYEDTSDIPVTVNGPLKAGVAAWGHGIFNLVELAKNLISAKRDANGKIVMKFKKASEYSLELKLDPAKDYAVESKILEWTGKTRISTACSDYVKYGKYWVPSTIAIDRTQYISEANPKQSGDLWQITSVDITPPAEDQFRADYNDNTRVKYKTMGKVMSYLHKKGRNAEYMLEHRKYNASLSNKKDRNCATAAMLYILSMFDKDINTANFEGLVTGTEKSTSLFKMDEFLKSRQLNCMAVKSDLKKLAALENCRVILHLPKPKHYVILDHIDKKYAWLIDLDSDKFYYRMPINRFKEQWKDRTALIVSDKPITAPAGSIEIPQDKLHQIKGATGGFGTYSCTDPIQGYDFQLCSQLGGFCEGTYIIWNVVKGCKLDTEGGYCGGEKLIGSISATCSNNESGECNSYGAWESHYIHGCGYE